jgi:rubrerythrin
MREEVLAGLPEQSWICGECGHTWERRRVSLPQRCPKCARPFSVRK